jgi:hypothetical protein
VTRAAPAPADELIWRQATTARVACQHITAPALDVLADSVDRASSLPTRPGWERKAAAHAEIFRLLAQIAGGRAAQQPDGGAAAMGELMRTVGPAANGIIIGSRRRLLAHLRAGNADAAEREMEANLRVLHFMWRLGAAQYRAVGDESAAVPPSASAGPASMPDRPPER